MRLKVLADARCAVPRALPTTHNGEIAAMLTDGEVERPPTSWPALPGVRRDQLLDAYARLQPPHSG
ncbi:hypothetical protein HBB16_19205 [Pseudonocardia sp. MCCB 268]|nr:hypothetical protein [Pseudonocardia cytotoxica]